MSDRSMVISWSCWQYSVIARISCFRKNIPILRWRWCSEDFSVDSSAHSYWALRSILHESIPLSYSLHLGWWMCSWRVLSERWYFIFSFRNSSRYRVHFLRVLEPISSWSSLPCLDIYSSMNISDSLFSSEVSSRSPEYTSSISKNNFSCHFSLPSTRSNTHS